VLVVQAFYTRLFFIDIVYRLKPSLRLEIVVDEDIVLVYNLPYQQMF